LTRCLARGFRSDTALAHRRAGSLWKSWHTLVPVPDTDCDLGTPFRSAVLVWEPPSVLEVEWSEREMQSIVRIEIAASGSGTVLLLDHRNLTSDVAVGIGAGWHAHLDALGDMLARRGEIRDRWSERHESLLPRYEELVSAR
jgi:hypothetical protein